MLPGALPFLLAAGEHQRPLPQEFMWLIAGIAAVLTIAGLCSYRTIARVGETHCVLNALSFSMISMPLLFLFPAHPELAAVVMTVLAFGDGSATLFGLLFGRQPLPWNASKTWVGFFSFFLVAALPTVLAYWTVARPAGSFGVATLCGIVPVVIAQIVESTTVNSSDNLRVGLAAAFGVLVAHTTLVGWP